MKRIVTLALLLTAGLTAHAQGHLFDLSDVDSNGWLWFDTQEKIDKYIGDDKLIKMVPAQWQEEVEPDVWENPVNTVSPETVGAGTDGYLPGFGDNGEPVGVNPKRGAITLAPANPYTSFNGGGVLMHMPSCYYLSFYMSAEIQIRPSIKGGHGTLETVDCANIKSFTFLKYASAGQCSWEVQDIVNLSEFCLKQETPVTAWFQNGNASQNYMYLHGIKALVYGVGTGVNETFADNKIPIVFFDRASLSGRYSCVVADNETSAYNATKHLIDCGATRIGFLGGDTALHITQERKHGYLQALKEHKIVIDKQLVVCGKMAYKEGQKSTRELLTRRPDAILAMNDTLTFAAMKEIKRQQLRIPQEIQLIGYTDELHSNFVEPALTAVTHHTYDIGTTACRLLLGHIHDRDKRPTTITIPTHLIARQSTKT